jgi:hypothetical protein
MRFAHVRKIARCDVEIATPENKDREERLGRK